MDFNRERLFEPKRRDSFSNDIPPVDYGKQFFQRLSSV